jgi:hypothetical protein
LAARRRKIHIEVLPPLGRFRVLITAARCRRLAAAGALMGAAVLAAAPVRAQQPKTPSPPPRPAAASPAPANQPAAAPATPAPITPAQLAAARDLVIASGLSRSFSVVIPQFIDQIGGSLTETRPELVEDLKAVFASLRPEFDKQADQMTDIAAQIFAKRLSEPDLKTANAFFGSPAGKQYVAAQPAILTDIVTAMQGWQGKLSTDMMTRVREEMKKKGHAI